MIACKTYTPHTEVMAGLYSLFFDMYPEMDPHEFATAYVNHVDKTGHKPEVWDAMESFWKTGKVC